MNARKTKNFRPPLVLHVVACSTRPGRVGDAVAKWFATEAAQTGHFQVELVDLKSFNLPVFNEPKHPRLGEYLHEHTRIWSEKVRQADAFVFVTPEYNHLPPASLVNAMTYLSKEWNYKAAGFLSYGGLSGGIRAVQAAKPLLSALRITSVLESISIQNVTALLSENGTFLAPPPLIATVDPFIRELSRVAESLLILRPERIRSIENIN